jgi:hypothetical protein
LSTAVICTLAVIATVLYFAFDAQINPIRLCEDCNGKPPGDGRGNFHDCPTCGGKPRRLRFGAWLQLKLGIPVPRSRPSSKRHRMSL